MTKLNCRAGDLAVVVKSTLGNEGKIVRCIKLLEMNENVLFADGQMRVIDHPQAFNEARWVIDRGIGVAIINGHSIGVPLCMDSCLRPIRDTDSEDEMLRIVGLPNKEVAHG